MVVYNNDRTDLNYIKEISPRHPQPTAYCPLPTQNALRFFMTEVLYKALREAEPMPALFDYVESVFNTTSSIYNPDISPRDLPISFLLTVARHLGIEPLDNQSVREPLFDLQEGRFVSVSTETTLSPTLSSLLHDYLNANHQLSSFNSSKSRGDLLNALLAYYHLHLSGFSHFHSHEILHTILK